MMVNYPLSRGFGNIAKVYLIICSQSTCAKLKKSEFCPVGHGGIAHIYIYIYIYILYNVGAVDYSECDYGECEYGGCVSVRVWPIG